MPRFIRRRSFWIALSAAGALSMSGIDSGAAGAKDAPKPATPDVNPASAAPSAADRMAPAEIVKPIPPNKAEMAEAAFKKLDATGKGYVTMADVIGLAGFDKLFQAADPEHTGKLDLAQFKKAWAAYTGYKQ